MHLRVPRAIEPGGSLAIVAPASPPGRYVGSAEGRRRFDDLELRRGLAWLTGQYRLEARADLLARDGYLAGTDGQRASALGRAMLDDSISGIASARGGYGVLRILDALPWAAFSRAPKWLFGFSDITALGLVALTHGVPSIHGPNVTSLASARPYDRFLLSSLLRGHAAERTWSLRQDRRGDAQGPVVGGNLTLVHALAAAGRLELPAGAILLLEDVTERPYRIDRMLTSLRLAGIFGKVAAVVFGDFTDCIEGPDGTTLETVLERFRGDVDCPVAWGAPFGHGLCNEAFVQGEDGTLASGVLTMSGMLPR